MIERPDLKMRVQQIDIPGDGSDSSAPVFANATVPCSTASLGSEETLVPSTDFRARILDSLYDGVYFVNRQREITYWNEGAERLTGFTAREILGSQCSDNLLSHVDDAGCNLCTRRCPLVVSMEEDRPLAHQLHLLHKEGYRIPVSVRTAPLKNDKGQIIGAVEIFSDSTSLKQLQKRVGELEAVAYRDSLTGLPNRRYTNLKIQQTIQEVAEFNRSFGLVVIDVDRFKDVNDLWGHDAGDAVLQAVSNTISHHLRGGDLIGRWGGDEFVAIVADVTPSSLKVTAERWRHLIANSQIRSSRGGIAVTASLGATLLTVGDTPESAIQRADELMYWSKQGRNHVTLG